MKTLIVNRDKMIEAVDMLDKIVHRKPIKSSHVVRLEYKAGKLYMQLSSDATAIARVTSSDGEWPLNDAPFFIDRRVLFPFIRVGKGSKGDFRISSLSGQLLLRQGTRKAKYTNDIEPAGYSPNKFMKGKVVAFDDQCSRVVQAAMVAASKDDREPEIACVYVDEKGTVRSTDNAVMFESETGNSFGKAFPIPTFAASLLSTAKSLAVNNSAMILTFGAGQICSQISDDARDHFPLDLFGVQFKAFKNVPVQIEMKVSQFHQLIVEHFDTYTSKLDNPSFLNITPAKVKGSRRAFDFSIYVSGSETTFLGRSISAASSSTKVEQTISAKRLAYVATMLKALCDSESNLSMRFDKDSHLLLEVETTTVCLVRALPGEPVVG